MIAATTEENTQASQNGNADTLNQYKLPIIIICAGVIAAICMFVLTMSINTRNLQREFDGDSKLQVSIFRDWLVLNINEVEKLSRFLGASDSDESAERQFHILVGKTLNREVFSGIYFISTKPTGWGYEVRSAIARGSDPENLLKEPALLSQIRQSIVYKKPVATQPIVFRHDSDQNSKVAIIYPIIKNEHAQNAIVAILDPGMLLETMRRQGNFNKAHEYIFDMGKNNEEEMIYGKMNEFTTKMHSFNAKTNMENLINMSAFSYSEELPLLGRKWQILFIPTNKFISGANTYTPWLLMLSCLMLSGMAGIFLFHLIGQNTHTERIVRERTAEILAISKQLKAQSRDLLRAKEIAEMANKAKGDFLANVSHEIRTPLSSMIGLSELMLEMDISPQIEHNLRTILNSGEVLLELINDMLDFSKIESGKLDLDPVPFDLLMAMEDTLEMFLPKAQEKEKQLELLLHFAPGVPRYVIGDVNRIRQILSNLLNNAIKFTQEGHILVKVEPQQDGLPRSLARIRVSVEDTGIGVPKEKLGMIFEKFTQADNSTTRKYGGTGLGLSICRQLAKMMGGDVSADSVYGKGSTFSFTMVLLWDNKTDEQPAGMTSFAGKKAFVVDDVEASRIILQAQLGSLGITSETAADFKTAYAVLSKAHTEGRMFDLLVTDYILPDMESEAFTQHIKMLYPELPIIMVTALADRGYSQIFASSGCDAYLTKPVKIGQLTGIIEKICRAKETGKSLSMLTPTTIYPKGKMTAKSSEDEKFLKGAEILLVEDNKANRELGIKLLENFACRPTIACNGEEAVEMVKKKPFDLILMDCQMPEMDGFEASSLMRKMKAKGEIADIPIIALTANAMQGDRERCLESGMNDYLTKPLRKTALRSILMEWLPPIEKRMEQGEGSWDV